MSIDAKRVIGVLLTLQMLFVGTTFGTLPVTAVCAMIAAILVYARLSRGTSARQARDKARIWSLVWIGQAMVFTFVSAAAAAWRSQAYVGEGVNHMVVAMDAVAHVCLLAGWIVWVLRPAGGHVSLLPLGMIVVLFCVAAGGASHSLVGQTTVALTACIGFVLASQAILSVDRAASGVVGGGEKDLFSGRRIRMATLLSLLTLSAILMATSAIAKVTSDALPSVQNMLYAKLKASIESAATETSIGGTRYVRGSRLGSIRQNILGDPSAVALRLYSKSAPGYLRGHAFDLYESRRWYVAYSVQLPNEAAVEETESRYVSPTGPGSTMLTNQLRRNLNRFPVHEDSQQVTITVETHNDPIKGPFVFTPLGTRWLEASSRQLTISHHGVVETGVDATRPYVAGVAPNAPQEPLTGERRKILLWVAGEIAELTEKLAAEICRGETRSRGKANAISRYFQKNFQYSLSGSPAPKQADPIVFFLENEHPAHCEYFASASVMLLRSSGVPARYVTGYVAVEKSDDSEHWIARNRDAHAWAEAYDDETQRWFPVESTPGRIYQTLDFGSAELNAQNLSGSRGADDDIGDRSWIGQVWGWLMSIRATDLLIIIFRIAQLPLFCVLAYLLWTRFGRQELGQVQPIDLKSLRMLRHVDRRMRKFALVREGHETLHQFAERIERRLSEASSLENGQSLVDAAAWYRQFAEARYRGRLPIPFQPSSENRVATGEH